MSEHSEWEWIQHVRSQCAMDPRIPLGIGDDAAVVNVPGGSTLVTTDMLMDGVDFVVGETPPTLIGRKCLAVNLSDIAAMAGRPTAAFVSLALPRHGGRALADGLYEGMFALASEFDVAIAGGDTNSWSGPLVVNVTLLGEPPAAGAVSRSGARPGDQVFVTGAVGGSLPSHRHCSFVPRVREAQALREAVDLHAMIDLSDGLATDLSHICAESGISIVIDADQVPIHDDVPPDATVEERLRHALTDGEDFELAFCVSPEAARMLLQSPPPGVGLYRIGECQSGQGLCLRQNGRVVPVGRDGWEHHFY